MNSRNQCIVSRHWLDFPRLGQEGFRPGNQELFVCVLLSYLTSGKGGHIATNAIAYQLKLPLFLKNTHGTHLDPPQSQLSLDSLK